MAPAPLCGWLRVQAGCPVLPLHMKGVTGEYEHLHFFQSLWTPAVKWCLETSIQLELGKPERTQDRPISDCQHNCSLHPALALLGLDKQSCVPAAEPSGLGSHPPQATAVPTTRAAPHHQFPCSPVSHHSCFPWHCLQVNCSSAPTVHQHPPSTRKASIPCTQDTVISF